jgi:hypothetical protein
MHFSFNLLIIKELYMFRALLAYSQEVLHKRHLVYFMRIMSADCFTVAVSVAVSLQPCHSQLTLYACNIPNAVCVEPPENEQIMLETCKGLWLSINWIKSASGWVSLYWYTTMHGQQNIKLDGIPTPYKKYSARNKLHFVFISSVRYFFDISQFFFI